VDTGGLGEVTRERLRQEAHELKLIFSTIVQRLE
jgi:hypothetical protein